MSLVLAHVLLNICLYLLYKLHIKPILWIRNTYCVNKCDFHHKMSFKIRGTWTDVGKDGKLQDITEKWVIWGNIHFKWVQFAAGSAPQWNITKKKSLQNNLLHFLCKSLDGVGYFPFHAGQVFVSPVWSKTAHPAFLWMFYLSSRNGHINTWIMY